MFPSLICFIPLCTSQPSLFTYLEIPFFVIVVRISIHSRLWLVVNCSPLAAYPPMDHVTFLHRWHHNISYSVWYNKYWIIFMAGIVILCLLLIRTYSNIIIWQIWFLRTPFIFHFYFVTCSLFWGCEIHLRNNKAETIFPVSSF